MSDRLGASINGYPVIEAGVRAQFNEKRVRTALGGDTVDLEVDLNVGSAEATAYGCDLTPGYITENAAYYSS